MVVVVAAVVVGVAVWADSEDDHELLLTVGPVVGNALRAVDDLRPSDGPSEVVQAI